MFRKLMANAVMISRSAQQRIRRPIWRRDVTLAVTICAGALLGCSDSTSPGSATILDPREKGSYNVGFTVFPATMSAGRSTLVHVYYPTTAPRDCATKYRVETAAGPYFLTSPLCAVAEAGVASGSHATIIYDHGAGGAGADFQRTNQLPLHELLASHGFIVVVALHSADAVARIRDLGALTTLMLGKSATAGDLFAGRVDASRIGISGLSAGAAAAFHFAAGRADAGIAPDPRVKAIVIYEPLSAAIALSDAATLKVPYLIMAGTQSSAGAFAPDLFAGSVAASPRIYVKNPGALHQSYVTELCAQIDEGREAALAANPNVAEPLTTNAPTSPGGSTAFGQWNIGAGQVPTFGLGFGGGRNICNRVGVRSVRSLDQNGDGFTDAPPFYTGVAPYADAATVGPAPSAELMVPTISLYTVSFFKAYLDGDRNYLQYLTPSYAQSHGLPAVIDSKP